MTSEHDAEASSRSTPRDFESRVALVTGAARGLGRAAAMRLLELGARVAIHVRDQARADEVADALGREARCGRRGSGA